MQGALPGLATQFPPDYMGALGLGNVTAGIITSILNIISISNMDADNNASPSSSAFYYFLVAAVVIIINIFVCHLSFFYAF